MSKMLDAKRLIRLFALCVAGYAADIFWAAGLGSLMAIAGSSTAAVIA